MGVLDYNLSAAYQQLSKQRQKWLFIINGHTSSHARLPPWEVRIFHVKTMSWPDVLVSAMSCLLYPLPSSSYALIPQMGHLTCFMSWWFVCRAYLGSWRWTFNRILIRWLCPLYTQRHGTHISGHQGQYISCLMTDWWSEQEGLPVTRCLTESSAYQTWQSIMVSHIAVDQFNS